MGKNIYMRSDFLDMNEDYTEDEYQPEETVELNDDEEISIATSYSYSLSRSPSYEMTEQPAERLYPGDIVIAKFRSFMYFQLVAMRFIECYPHTIIRLNIDLIELIERIVDTLASNFLPEKGRNNIEPIVDGTNTEESFIRRITKFAQMKLPQLIFSHYREESMLENGCGSKLQNQIINETSRRSTNETSNGIMDNLHNLPIMVQNIIQKICMNGTKVESRDNDQKNSIGGMSNVLFPGRHYTSLFSEVPHGKLGAARMRCAAKLHEFRQQRLSEFQLREQQKLDLAKASNFADKACSFGGSNNDEVIDDEYIPEYVCSRCLQCSKTHKERKRSKKIPPEQNGPHISSSLLNLTDRTKNLALNAI